MAKKLLNAEENDDMEEELFELNGGEAAELPNTPEEEAFRLAEKIYPITANTLRKQSIVQADLIRFEPKKIYELAHYINENLTNEKILESALSFSNDTRYEPFNSDNLTLVYFDAEGLSLFLKWCEPREKGLFD